MSATVTRLPTAAAASVVQPTVEDEELRLLAKMLANKIQREGKQCNFDDVLATCRGLLLRVKKP